jgi:hypothetical protein
MRAHGGYYARNPKRWYSVEIMGFSLNVKADSRGAARYEAWLNFHDSYDIPFGEFCKLSSCKGA